MTAFISPKNNGVDILTIMAQQQLNPRLIKPPDGKLDILSDLEHFALINYTVPKARLEPHIPTDRFLIPEFDVDGE